MIDDEEQDTEAIIFNRRMAFTQMLCQHITEAWMCMEDEEEMSDGLWTGICVASVHSLMETIARLRGTPEEHE